MTEKEKMLAGMPYNPKEKDLVSLRNSAREATEEFNSIKSQETEKKEGIIKKLFGKTGESVHIEQGFRCDYGFNIEVGENFSANFNCIILDSAKVNIGKNCVFGPNVQIYTACHPITPNERAAGLEFARAVEIGDNCFIGGSAVINPGIILGNNVVVGSGSVVTKNFGDNVVIGGNPARVLKIID